MTIILAIALFWIVGNHIAQTVRITNYEGDKKLRQYFDEQGESGNHARKLMRDAGYDV